MIQTNNYIESTINIKTKKRKKNKTVTWTPQLQTPVTPDLDSLAHRRITWRHLPSPGEENFYKI